MSTLPPEPQLMALDAGPARVLLVEDDALLARSLSRLMRASGATVTQVGNGALAAQMMKVRCFDVVLTDVSMPEVGGLEVAARAREHDAAMSVILMTGAPSVETAVRAMELGATRYLVKPMQAEVLLSSVTEATRLCRQRRTTPGVIAARGASIEDPLEDQFDEALDQLWMAYQPIFRNDGSLYGFEALLRSDGAALRSPAELLAAADRLRRVHDLGRRIRASVGAMLVGAPAGPRVFVNLHPLDLLDDALYGTDDPLAPHARRVVLEITERAALDELPDAEARIRALRDLGYTVAVDDLGAGYAGLTTLARLSPEVVKLDMSLIRNIDRDPVRQKLVRMVTAVSHDLGAVVVAEGIETQAERAVVQDLGCDLIQGYLLGKPARVQALKAAL